MNTRLTEPDTRFEGIAKPHFRYGKNWDGSIPAGAIMHSFGGGRCLVATETEEDGTVDYRYVIHHTDGTLHRLKPCIYEDNRPEYENLGWINTLKKKLLDIDDKCRHCHKEKAKELHHIVPRHTRVDEVLYNLNGITIVCHGCHLLLDMVSSYKYGPFGDMLRRIGKRWKFGAGFVDRMCLQLAEQYNQGRRT